MITGCVLFLWCQLAAKTADQWPHSRDRGFLAGALACHTGVAALAVAMANGVLP